MSYSDGAPRYCVSSWNVFEQVQNLSGDYDVARHAVQVRAIRPEDLIQLRSWFTTVSPESRYARFLGYVTELSAKQWRYLTNVDGHDHVAFVAWQGGAIIGVARWVRLDDPELAEVAFLVGDAVQRTGVGTLLCARLVEAARAHGVRRFRAHVLSQNRGIRRLLSGPEFRQLRDNGGTVDVEILG